MKRNLRKILTLCIALALLLALLPAAPGLAAEAPLKHGDANGDGKLDASDAALILRHLAGLITLEGAQLAAANADGIGDVTAADAALVLRHLAGLATIPDWVEQPSHGLTIAEAYEMARGKDFITNIEPLVGETSDWEEVWNSFTPTDLNDFYLNEGRYFIYVEEETVGLWIPDWDGYLLIWDLETGDTAAEEYFTEEEDVIAFLNGLFGAGAWTWEYQGYTRLIWINVPDPRFPDGMKVSIWYYSMEDCFYCDFIDAELNDYVYYEIPGSTLEDLILALNDIFTDGWEFVESTFVEGPTTEVWWAVRMDFTNEYIDPFSYHKGTYPDDLLCSAMLEFDCYDYENGGYIDIANAVATELSVKTYQIIIDEFVGVWYMPIEVQTYNDPSEIAEALQTFFATYEGTGKSEFISEIPDVLDALQMWETLRAEMPRLTKEEEQENEENPNQYKGIGFGVISTNMYGYRNTGYTVSPRDEDFPNVPLENVAWVLQLGYLGYGECVPCTPAYSWNPLVSLKATIAVDKAGAAHVSQYFSVSSDMYPQGFVPSSGASQWQAFIEFMAYVMDASNWTLP
ncbi:MAG: dockerin type I repeat-containing protein [Clostridiales bacterium]|nr:dockerin type I repeat-containing protein [Clostridiales bacterium]